MEINILDKKTNPLLKREEIVALIVFEKSTPGRDEIKKEIANNLKANRDLIVIENIRQKFGSKEVEVTANIYETEKAKAIEREYKLKRGVKEEKEKKEAPAPAAEKPAEEKPKEEKPPEKPEEKEEKKGE